MYKKVADLYEGCVLLEDVMGATTYPLIKKFTVLNSQHIKFLKAFLIRGVEVGEWKGEQAGNEVENTIIEGNNNSISIIAKNHFADLFSKSVDNYKKEFHQWQSGMRVDIVSTRKIILPLLEYVLKRQKPITELHKYTNKKDYMFQHPVAVGLLSAAIANKLKQDKGAVIQAALAGLLADCGMAKIKPAILLKTSPLNDKEYNDIKDHPHYSYNMVKELSLLKPETKVAVFQHHERMDGSGYLMGEKAGKLHLLSQIVAVADTFHAMTSERLYRTQQPPFKVLEMIKEDFFGKFDITVVKTLISLFTSFSPGVRVKLSDQQEGTILFVKREHPTRPLIKLTDETIVDLEKRRDLYIEQVL
jgi:HD-GYP domain-containing protein (c-di-GMP phosphodiesterase class II)